MIHILFFIAAQSDSSDFIRVLQEIWVAAPGTRLCCALKIFFTVFTPVTRLCLVCTKVFSS